jgi:dolichol-phosphate mannosyltransferase
MQLSIVAPCYNEADNIAEFRRHLEAVASRLTAKADAGIDSVQFVLVDDGSRDNTLAQLRSWASEDDRVCAVALSRNFGHQAALSAGIDHATGDAVVVMDADLQHPPELIPQFVQKWKEGYDLVYAYREGARPRLGYRLINALMKIRIPPESADFRLMSRPLVAAFRQMPERARFIRGMISWLGFKQVGVGYKEHERFAGDRGYTLRQTAHLALNGVLAFSNIPLRVASFLGLLTLLAGLAYSIYILIAYELGMHFERGWTALIMAVLILGGVQLLCLGIIAEYIGRIFDEVKQRPLYVVREIIHSSDQTDQRQ